MSAARDGGRRTSLALIVNPAATTVTTHRTDLVAGALEAGGFDVDVQRTDNPGHATQLAAAACGAGADVVAVYGGDGTANEAIRAVAGTSAAFAHLPGGNSSVLARMLGMGGDAVRAAAGLFARYEQGTTAIDLGDADGRPFAFTAGIGLDAAVVRLVDADAARKHRFRWGAFWMEAVRLARSEYFCDAAKLTVESGGESRAGITAIIQNAPSYTYLGPRALTVGDDAGLTTGKLAATALLPGLGWRDVPTITARTVGPIRASGHPHIEPLPSSAEVTVTCREPLPIQLDGDYWKDVREVRFTVRPEALRVVGQRPAGGGAKRQVV